MPATSLTRHCHVTAMSLPCHCHGTTTALPCHCHVTATALPIINRLELTSASDARFA